MILLHPQQVIYRIFGPNQVPTWNSSLRKLVYLCKKCRETGHVVRLHSARSHLRHPKWKTRPETSSYYSDPSGSFAVESCSRCLGRNKKSCGLLFSQDGLHMKPRMGNSNTGYTEEENREAGKENRGRSRASPDQCSAILMSSSPSPPLEPL